MADLSVDRQWGVGLEFEGFRLENALESGSPGALYIAVDGQRRRLVLRLLGPHGASGSERLRRLDGIRHRHLAEYEGGGVVPGGPLRGNYWIVRADLPRRLSHRRAYGPFGAGRVRVALRDLAAGLAHLHSQGVVHGDVKPSNVALREDESFQLLDFVLLPVLVDSLTRAESRHRRFYFAPEVLDGVATADSDAYSLAATAVVLAGGEPRAGTPRAVLDEVAGEWPADLHDLLRGCLLAEPAARPTVAALLAYLEEDAGRVRELFDVTLQDVATGRAFRAALRHLSVPPSLTVEDLRQASILRVLRRAEHDASLMLRLSGPAALTRYLTVTARNLVIDERRSSRSFPHADPYVLAPEEPSADPFTASETAHAALSAVARLLGPTAARVLWQRAYGRGYAEIAADLAVSGEAWSEYRVFLTVYRLRRAYPELVDVLPPDDPDAAERYLDEWLGHLGLADDGKRRTLAALLGGQELAVVAAREGISPSSVQRRVNRMAKEDHLAALLLRGVATDLDELARAARYFGASALLEDPPDLHQPWLHSVREQANALMAAVLGEGLEPGEEPLTAQEAVNAILADVELALEAQQRLLAEPMTPLPSGLPGTGASPALRERLLDAADSGELVVVDTRDGQLVPDFQLVGRGAEGEPTVDDTVARVNKRLAAGEDPVGALAWWTQGNAWIGGARPVDLLAQDRDRLLRLAEATGDQAA